MRLLRLLLWSLAIVCPCAQAAITATRDGLTLRLANGVVEARFDPATGRLSAYGPLDQPSRVGGSALAVGMDGKADELAAATPALERWQPTPDGVDITWSAPRWRVTEHWRLAESSCCLRRSVTLLPLEADGTMAQVRLRLNGLSLPAAADARYVLPQGFPILDQAVADNLAGRDRHAGSASTNRLVVLRSLVGGRALLALGDDGDDPSWAHVVERAGGLDVEHCWNVETETRAGQPIDVGTQVLTCSAASVAAISAASWEALDQLGRRVPNDRPADLDRTVVYSAHAGGTIDSDWRDTGGFGPMTARLDRIAALGANTLWMLPFWKGAVYAPVDYAAHDDRLGTERQLRDLVATAGRRGVKVLADLVPHGPREEGGLLAAHPDWVSRQKDGRPIIWWGCLSCDYANPGWQGYMADHAVDWMKRVGLAGYRVDVAGGGPPNWRPYGTNRPSNSSIKGSHDLLATVRAAIKRQDARAMLIQEGTMPQLATTGDLIYDFPWAYEVLPRALDMAPEDWVPAVANWLTWRPAQYPRGTRFMRYVTSHDTIRGLPRYGASLHRALLLLTAMVDGAPMVYDREEQGHELALAPVYQARGGLLPIRGPVEFVRVGQEPDVLCWRAAQGPKLPLVALNLGADTAVFDLPQLSIGLTWTVLHATGPTVSASASRVTLAPGEAGVLSDRPWAAPEEAVPAPPSVPAEPAEAALASVTADGVTLRIDPRRGGAVDSVWLSTKGGPLRAADAETWREGPRKLFVGTAPLDLDSAPATVSREGQAVSCVATVADKLRVARRYEPAATGLRVTLSLEALEPVEAASSELRWVLPLRGEGWRAETVEGTLAGRPDPTVGAGQRREWQGYRYRHPAGPLWRGALQPLAGGCGVELGGTSLLLADVRSSQPGLPHDLLLLDNGHGADLVIDWCNGRQPVTLRPGQPLSLSFLLTTRTAPPLHPRLSCQGGNWHLRGRGFEAVIGRSGGGSLRRLSRLRDGRPERSLLDGSNTYTDNGLYATWTDPLGQQHKVNVGSNLDVEPDVTLTDDGKQTRLAFQGVLSGDQGFGMSIQRPYTWYRHEFVVDDGPSLRMKMAIRPRSGFERRAVSAFVAHTLRFLRVSAWGCDLGDGHHGEPMPADRFERICQAREHGGVGPGRYELTIDGRPLTLTVRAGGRDLQNAFLISGSSPVLFLAHYDNQPVTIAPAWHEVELEIQP